MAVGSLRRRVAPAVVAALLAIGALAMRWAADTAEHNALYEQVSQLYSAGKYTEALPAAEQYVAAVRERYGEEHEQFAVAVLWLGTIHRVAGRP